MKNFVFRLQTSLDLKLKAEDMKKEELQKATKVYKQNLKTLKGLQNRLVEIQDILRGKQVKKMDIVEIKNCQDFIPVLEERIKNQVEVTAASRIEMERVRNELVEIMKERKMLEKLRAKQYQEYMREYLREEQKEIDELATIGFMHKDSAV